MSGTEPGASAEPAIAEALAAVGRGALIVLPTDTVYGIGTRPDDPVATGLLFAAKERPGDLTLPVLVPDVGAARSVGRLDERAERLAAACWPGPVTLVVPRSSASAGWDLGGDRDTVGLRVPDDPLALTLLAATGPLAVTSANRSGDPPARTCDELVAAFGDQVAVYLCQDQPLEGTSSTVVDLAHGEVVVLREGRLGGDEVRRLLEEGDPSFPGGSPEDR